MLSRSVRIVDTSPNDSVALRHVFVAWVLAIAALALVTVVRHALDWCPTQAYAVLLMLCSARVLRHRTHGRRLGASVGARTCAGYCMRCRSMAVHRCGATGPPEESAEQIAYRKKTDESAADVDGVYTSAYYVPPRSFLILMTTAAWVAYGALFHEGKHANELETILFAASSELVARVVHTVRLLVYFGVALVAVKRRRGSSMLHAALWTLFFSLLAFPPDEAIVQRMTLADAILRLSLFSSLLVASDSLDVAMHYTAWIESVRTSKAMKMRVYALSAQYPYAFGAAQSNAGNGSSGGGGGNVTCACGTNDGVLVTYTWLLRTAWVLVVTNCYVMTTLALIEFLWIAWCIFTHRALSMQLVAQTASSPSTDIEQPARPTQQRQPSLAPRRQAAAPIPQQKRAQAQAQAKPKPKPNPNPKPSREDELLSFLSAPVTSKRAASLASASRGTKRTGEELIGSMDTLSVQEYLAAARKQKQQARQNGRANT